MPFEPPSKRASLDSSLDEDEEYDDEDDEDDGAAAGLLAARAAAPRRSRGPAVDRRQQGADRRPMALPPTSLDQQLLPLAPVPHASPSSAFLTSSRGLLGAGGSLGGGRRPHGERASALGLRESPSKRLDFPSPAEPRGARWHRSDAAREATVGAHAAADAAEVVAGQARDSALRAMEARNIIADQMGAFQTGGLGGRVVRS